jgi:polyphosphate kinase 2
MGRKAGKKKQPRNPPKNDEAKIPSRMKRKDYERELLNLQVELASLQEWVKEKGKRIVVLFEGRDAAGKGGVIKRITERVSPRVFRVVALPAPTDRERSQYYLQRYIAQLPAAGEIVLFDRSWYNRAGVERVMNFCTEQEYEEFLRVCPSYERDLSRSGIMLIKYFFLIGQEEQERRFLQRINDPLRHWKLSPMDIESYRRWWDYTIAYDRMVAATDTDYAPWYVVQADNKRQARLNCIAHLLSVIPYKRSKNHPPDLPERLKRPKGAPERPKFTHFVPQKY